MNENILNAQNLNERDLIAAILASFYIVDYGYINKVNPDKTVNVTHAVKEKLWNGTELPETVTEDVQVLTICGAGFSVNFDYKAGDRVLLLGLRNYIDDVTKVSSAQPSDVYIHYNRASIKAIPLCVFSDDAKVKIDVTDGKMTITASDEVIISCSKMTVKGSAGSAALEVTP